MSEGTELGTAWCVKGHVTVSCGTRAGEPGTSGSEEQCRLGKDCERPPGIDYGFRPAGYRATTDDLRSGPGPGDTGTNLEQVPRLRAEESRETDSLWFGCN